MNSLVLHPEIHMFQGDLDHEDDRYDQDSWSVSMSGAHSYEETPQCHLRGDS